MKKIALPAGAGQAGFTLIELLVVMIIMGLLASLVAPKLFTKVDTARQQAAKAQIEMFGTALDAFRLDCGKYPTTDQGLKTLREKPSGTDCWRGPYLPKELPKDPWDGDYVYKSPGDHGDFDIMSYGADHAPGGEGNDKDITSWKGIKD
ncbi:MAG: type II secretion system major pseudopilin GspG [Deltaproteobacteria bacterium]|nr:type II secretion system major pseudopilin GspG [Deltaproteobacteria bacterium]